MFVCLCVPGDVRGVGAVVNQSLEREALGEYGAHTMDCVVVKLFLKPVQTSFTKLNHFFILNASSSQYYIPKLTKYIKHKYQINFIAIKD